MKSRLFKVLAVSGLVLIVAGPLWAQIEAQSASVGVESAEPLVADVTNSRLGHILRFIQDSAGNKITASTAACTPLFESRKGNPVLAPDGHQLTLAEFLTPNGSENVYCKHSYTRSILHLSGLVPKGVYTLWILVFKSPGSSDPANRVGVGALGANDGSENIFTADENGEADVSIKTHAEPLSINQFELGKCFLTQEFEVHFVGAYHIDGKTYGTTPGPAGTFVDQFFFKFLQQK